MSAHLPSMAPTRRVWSVELLAKHLKQQQPTQGYHHHWYLPPPPCLFQNLAPRVNHPIAINCNVNGGNAVSTSVAVAAGAQFEFEWYHDNRGDEIIAAVSGLFSRRS